jgi:hypothetical protein
MHKFIDTQDLPKLYQKDTNDLNSPVEHNDIKAVIKSPNTEDPRTRWVH